VAGKAIQTILGKEVLSIGYFLVVVLGGLTFLNYYLYWQGFKRVLRRKDLGLEGSWRKGY